MRPRRPPFIALVLLQFLASSNEPLAGDLLESWKDRHARWLWRQLLLALAPAMLLRLRTIGREAAGDIMVRAAMLTLLGFSTVVAASLFHRLLVMAGVAPLPSNASAGYGLAVVATLATAIAVGRTLGPLHRDHPVVVAIAWAASASAAAFLNLHLLVPDIAARPFVADRAPQIALAMLFVAGLLAGVSTASRGAQARIAS